MSADTKKPEQPEFVVEIGWWKDRPYVETASGPIDSMRLYIWEIERVTMLPYWQEKMLCEQIEEGKRGAREHLTLAHLRMVPPLARRYSEYGVSLADLIQEGNLGLQKAVEKYDYRQGFRFASFAAPVIEMTIKRALANTARTIRIPVHAQERLARIRRAQRRLGAELLREATIAEVAELLWPIDAEEIEWLLSISSTPASLNSPRRGSSSHRSGSWDGTGRDEAIDVLVEQSEPSPEERLLEAERERAVRNAVRCLNERERRVIEGRHGIDGEERTLAELGEEMGLTRERVRQIESQATEKLRLVLSEERADTDRAA